MRIYFRLAQLVVLLSIPLAAHGEDVIIDSVEDHLQDLYDDPGPLPGRRNYRDEADSDSPHFRPTDLSPLDPDSFAGQLEQGGTPRRHKGGIRFTKGKSGKKKSCHTRCHESTSPYCGAWMHSDNSAVANGVYILNSSFVNLTCTVHSLPKPATIKWVFHPESGAPNRPKEPVCTSMRTVTDCKFNYLGEHRVRSTCLKRMAKLEHTGTYYCRVVNSGGKEIASTPTKVKVYGIAKLQPVIESIDIMYNKTSTLQVAICANPLPEITWINHITGSIVRSGQTVGNYTALPLRRLVNAHGVYVPAHVQQFCYTAELIISKTTASEKSFTILATNNVDSKSITMTTRISGLPLKDNGAVPLALFAQYSFVRIIVPLIVAFSLL